jgi:hypothetical protein
MMLSVAGFIIAAPTPCRIRQVISSSGELASPHSSDATVNTTSPATKIRRRPSRSASLPPVSMNAANVSA